MRGRLSAEHLPYAEVVALVLSGEIVAVDSRH